MSSSNHPFDVWIHPHAWIKLNEYAAHALPTEIGGLAKVRIEDESVFVEDVHMMKQDASMVTFDINSDMIQAWTLDMIRQGREDELHMWRSIVHSHPEGMGAEMSQTDVNAIKRFAEDEDAFSLIISASKNADSTKMLMHYCGNIRGRKVLFHDMPVHVAYSTTRLELGEKLALNLAKHFEVEGSEADVKVLKQVCKTFMASKVPHMFKDERRKLSTDIMNEVKTLITKPTKSWTNKSGYTSGYQSTGMGGHGGLWDELDAEEEAYYNARWMSKKETAEEAIWQNIQDLEAKIKDKDTSKTQRKKASKALVVLIDRLNHLIRPMGGIGYKDMVVVSNSHKTPENMHLFEGEHEVEDIHFGAFNLTFYVDGEAFLDEELTLMTPYETVREQEAAATASAYKEITGVASN